MTDLPEEWGKPATKDQPKGMVLRLSEANAEIERLKGALRTALGMLDDPTGGEHVRDMRTASHVIRQALEKNTTDVR